MRISLAGPHAAGQAGALPPQFVRIKPVAWTQRLGQRSARERRRLGARAVSGLTLSAPHVRRSGPLRHARRARTVMRGRSWRTTPNQCVTNSPALSMAPSETF